MAGVKRYDAGLTLEKPQRMDNGFLRVDGYIARTGVQEYTNADGSKRREYRPPDEVFKTDAMGSFDRAPVTVEHPREGFVTAKNRKHLSVGTVGNLRRVDNKFLAASLQVEDADAVSQIEQGKQEVSCGYYCDLEDTSGTSPEGEKYDCIQRNIRGNHVAIVSAGRAGPLVRVRMDNQDAELVASQESPEGLKSFQEKRNVKITVDGIEIEVPDTAGAVVSKALKDREAKLDASEKASREHLAAKSAAEARAEAAKEAVTKAEAARADALDPKRLDEAVAERVALIQKATEILGEAPKAGVSARDIKVAVITKLSPSFKADGKDDVYISVRYDAALEFASSELVTAMRSVSSPIHADSTQAQDLDKARRDFEARNQQLWNPKK